MNHLIKTHQVSGLIALLILLLGSSASYAAIPVVNFDATAMIGIQESTLLLLADAEEATGEQEILKSLDEAEKDDASKKKCMTVCEKWGEDCVINPRTGARKCRKMCKKLAQECF